MKKLSNKTRVKLGLPRDPNKPHDKADKEILRELRKTDNARREIQLKK